MIEPVSTGLEVVGIARLTGAAVDSLRRRDEVKSFFRELRGRLKADGRIPYDKRDWVVDKVVGRTEVWRPPEIGLQVDPHFLGCLKRVLDDGDELAFDDMRRVLDEKLTLNEPDVDTQEIIDVIIDSPKGPSDLLRRATAMRSITRVREHGGLSAKCAARLLSSMPTSLPVLGRLTNR